MRCSNCSEEIKPIVAVDIDGTLGDYHGHFLSFAQEYVGRRPITKTYGGRERFSAFCMSSLNISHDEYNAIKLAYRQGGQKRSMPIYPSASGLVHGLEKIGVEIWMTTTRPYLSLDTVIPDTVEWLQRNDLPYYALLFDQDKYAVLAHRVDRRRVVAVLDDLPEMYDAASKEIAHEVPILIKSYWNRDVHRPYSSSLVDVLEALETRIDIWREHAGRLPS